MIWRYLPPNGGGTGGARHARRAGCAPCTGRDRAAAASFMPFAFQRDQADRQARGVELLHDRRQRAGRQAPQIGHRQVRDSLNADSALVPGWKKTLMMLTPGSDRDSM